MVTMPEWRVQLQACAKLPASRRGLTLEQIVADIFRAHHFTVLRGPGVARPRQTDVLAVRPPDRYLIECKWRSRPADIADLDNLRSRLRRTVVSTKVVCDGPGEQRAENVKAATA